MNDGPCHLCGEPTESLAGNPGRWPLLLPAPDATGVCRHWHAGCVMARLAEADRLRGRVAELEACLRVPLQKVVCRDAGTNDRFAYLWSKDWQAFEAESDRLLGQKDGGAES
jgi:hypothetical protein